MTSIQSRLNSARINYLLGIIIMAFIVFCFAAYAIINSWNSGNIAFPEITSLSYASLILFIIICVFGTYSNNLYFTFLVFILLAFPAPINDFFPGTQLGDPKERGSAIFPFFTHIDLYLIIGILKAVFLNNKVYFKGSVMFFVVVICLAASILTNYFKSESNHQLLLLIQGLHQFRYLVELFVLMAFFQVSKFKNHIIIGFVVSILFLFLESSIYSAKLGSLRLLSGSLANNTYASIVAAILLFLFYIKKRYAHSFTYKVLLNITMGVCVVTIIATGARMPILALIIAYAVLTFMDHSSSRSFLGKVNWTLGILTFVAVVIVVSNFLPKRYNPKTITEKIAIGEFSSDLTKFIKIERSWETSSLITRLHLYNTSLAMFMDNKIEGIGVGRWNSQKKMYGFALPVLIDSHNGYLSVISQYGLLGLPLIFFIYIYPMVRLYRERNSETHPNFLFYLALICFYMAMADLSNSSMFKHQVFGTLAFCVIIVLQMESSEKTMKLTISKPEKMS